ncbi:MFS transporter, partial [Streptomyces griseus]|nr:MFS transporter [Streptomyces griseus]
FSLGITWLALRLGRRLTPVQDQPPLAAVPSRVVAVSLPDGADGPAPAANTASHASPPASAGH